MGQLSNTDIFKECNSHGLMIIPFDQSRLKGASYDISPTIIAMSTKTGLLETVYREKEYPFKHFIYVKPKDTVLTVSREYVSVPSNISGYVVSRVSKVAEGFGHVSTSIDPNWKGALLIALSNPSNKPIKIYVGGSSEATGGSNSLATISFHYLSSPCEESDNKYEGMRLDLLNKVKYSRRRGLRAALVKTVHPNRRKYTDFFFNYCRNHPISADEWENAVSEFQGEQRSDCVQCKYYSEGSKRKKQRLNDFVVTEHFSLRLWHLLQRHWESIMKTLAIILALLVAFNLLPTSIKNALKSFFNLIQPF